MQYDTPHCKSYGPLTALVRAYAHSSGVVWIGVYWLCQSIPFYKLPSGDFLHIERWPMDMGFRGIFLPNYPRWCPIDWANLITHFVSSVHAGASPFWGKRPGMNMRLKRIYLCYYRARQRLLDLWAFTPFCFHNIAWRVIGVDLKIFLA
jgi:hypothetical protein